MLQKTAQNTQREQVIMLEKRIAAFLYKFEEPLVLLAFFQVVGCRAKAGWPDFLQLHITRPFPTAIPQSVNQQSLPCKRLTDTQDS